MNTCYDEVMELRQLKYFIKAAELLNFTEAAEAVNISQSTLSQQIQQLEFELKTPLFNRVARRVTLTESGKIFLSYARQTVYVSEQGRKILNEINHIERGEINIGVTYAVREIIVKAITTFNNSYPNIKLNVFFATTKELIAQLKEMKLDIVVSFLDNNQLDEQLHVKPLLKSSMVLAQSALNPLVTDEYITIKNLVKLPMALADKRFSTRQYLDEIFKKNGVKPKIDVEINDISILFRLVETGKWVSIISKVTIDPERKLSYIPIKGMEKEQEASLITLKDIHITQAVKKFCSLLAENID